MARTTSNYLWASLVLYCLAAFLGLVNMIFAIAVPTAAQSERAPPQA